MAEQVTAATAAPIDRNTLAAEVLQPARRWARSRIRGNAELAERCEDAATDAILWAINHFDGLRPWHSFVWPAVKKFVNGEISNHHRKGRPAPSQAIIETGDEPPAPPDKTDARPALSLDAASKLPPDLLEAVRLVYLDGHTLREAGEVAGASYEMIRKRLKMAAARLGGLPPSRPRPLAGRRKAVARD